MNGFQNMRPGMQMPGQAQQMQNPNAQTFQLMQAINASHQKMKAQNPMSWQAQMPPAERLGIIRSM